MALQSTQIDRLIFSSPFMFFLFLSFHFSFHVTHFLSLSLRDFQKEAGLLIIWDSQLLPVNFSYVIVARFIMMILNS